jgi:hypothetical protein
MTWQASSRSLRNRTEDPAPLPTHNSQSRVMVINPGMRDGVYSIKEAGTTPPSLFP